MPRIRRWIVRRLPQLLDDEINVRPARFSAPSIEIQSERAAFARGNLFEPHSMQDAIKARSWAVVGIWRIFAPRASEVDFVNPPFEKKAFTKCSIVAACCAMCAAPASHVGFNPSHGIAVMVPPVATLTPGVHVVKSLFIIGDVVAPVMHSKASPEAT